MAFPTGWGRKCELVFQHGQVTETLSNYPALIAKDSLPSEIFDADGSYPALNGGGDIRFSSDSAGATQLACEIEEFVTDNNPANGKSSVWVNVPSLSSSANTSIFIWYNKAAESQPAEGDTYGKHNVWDANFKMVHHLAETPTANMIDSTSNSKDGTTVSMDSADQIAGKINGSLDFDGADHVTTTHTPDPRNASTLSFWVKHDDVTKAGNQLLGAHDGSNRFYFGIDAAAKIMLGVGNSYKNAVASGMSNGVWYKYTVRITGTSALVYINGVYKDTLAYTASAASAVNFHIGRRNHGSFPAWLDGQLDELQVSDITRSTGWDLTGYNNQHAPATFLIEGTPSTPGAAANAPTGVFYGPFFGPFMGAIG